MKLGDKVKWYTRTHDPFTDNVHVGTVVGVVAARQLLRDVAMEEKYWLRRLPANELASRNHESYVVFVPPDTPGGWGKLYWPRVSGLRMAA